MNSSDISSDSTIQQTVSFLAHSPDLGIDDAGQLIAITCPDNSTDDRACSHGDGNDDADRLARLIGWLHQGRADAKLIGERVLILGYFVKSSDDCASSIEEIARRSGMTKGTVSKRMDSLKVVMPELLAALRLECKQESARLSAESKRQKAINAVVLTETSALSDERNKL